MMNMIMSFLIIFFFVVLEINGVFFFEGEEGEFFKLIFLYLFLLIFVCFDIKFVRFIVCDSVCF